MTSCVTEIENGRGELCREIMTDLKEWFTEDAVIEASAVAAKDFPMFAFRSGDAVDGIVSLKNSTPHAVEILLIGVRKNRHGAGVGTHLLEAAEDFAKKSGASMLTVKTLARQGSDEPQYEQTREFYIKNGFLPIDVLETLWGENAPCLYMVKPLGG